VRWVRDGLRVESEARLRRHDGEYRWFLTCFNPARYASRRSLALSLGAYHGIPIVRQMLDRDIREARADIDIRGTFRLAGRVRLRTICTRSGTSCRTARCHPGAIG
jgi:hypothetical protein